MGRGLIFWRLLRSLPLLAFFFLAIWVGAGRVPTDASALRLWAGRLYAVAGSRLAGMAGEFRRLKAVGMAASGTSTFMQPVAGKLLSTFGWRSEAGGVALFDQGIRVAALPGAPVESSTGGTVLSENPRRGEIIVAGGKGSSTDYLGLGGFAVVTGAKVVPAEILGWIGTAGRFELKVLVDGRTVDPLGPTYLGKWGN